MIRTVVYNTMYSLLDIACFLLYHILKLSLCISCFDFVIKTFKNAFESHCTFFCVHLLWRLWRFAHSYFSDLWTRELWCNRQIRQNQEFSNVLRQFGPDDFNKHSVPLMKNHYCCDHISKKLYFTWMTKIRLNMLLFYFVEKHWLC